ncbi:MAG: tetratricopeptide repeat protein [Myxococcales bacterium]|nr:tetratricopeptide repeat protein [Myxococcales bacterium]MCB9748410.1 tetratricopeptide repeat protein [Myxococcales bacterium]
MALHWTSRRRVSWRLPAALLVLVATALASPGRVLAAPSARESADPKMQTVDRVLDGVALVIREAAKAGAEVEAQSEALLAKRLVDAQLLLEEGEAERAAIVFFDLSSNFASSAAGPEALVSLGEALAQLGMRRWAVECFVANLVDKRPAAKRFNQQSIARLLDLSAPRRELGFAERPGLSAMPETRGRLRSLGLPTTQAPLPGALSQDSATRLVGWVKLYPGDARTPELRYAYGRYLFLTGAYQEAIEELDALSPISVPLSRGGPGAKWRVRAAYIAAASSVALGLYDEAIERFKSITKAQPSSPRDREIVELAWLGRARVHFDLGDYDLALASYRAIPRSSPLFPEAVYETVWTLMREGHFEQADNAIALLLSFDPQNPAAPELKQLRGKIRIRQRDWQAAEEEFVLLQREFAGAARGLRHALALGADAAEYFKAVIGGADMEHFSLDAVVPVAAGPIVRRLDRAVQAESVAREFGVLARELQETRAMLKRMELATEARERSRLFTDLGAHKSSLERARAELLDVAETLAERVSITDSNLRTDLKSKRKELRGAIAEASRGGESQAAIKRMMTELIAIEGAIMELRAALVAAERFYMASRVDKQVDASQANFLAQATELRATIGAHERDAATLRAKLEEARVRQRFADPGRARQRQLELRYREYLEKVFAASKSKSADATGRWARMRKLEQQVELAAGQLERVAGKRLAAATSVLREERVNLDLYQRQLDELGGRARETLGEVMEATFRDVASELAHWQVRSEVGLLDIVWAIKQVETDAAQQIEKQRDRDLRLLDEVVKHALEEMR